MTYSGPTTLQNTFGRGSEPGGKLEASGSSDDTRNAETCRVWWRIQLGVATSEEGQHMVTMPESSPDRRNRYEV